MANNILKFIKLDNGTYRPVYDDIPSEHPQEIWFKSAEDAYTMTHSKDNDQYKILKAAVFNNIQDAINNNQTGMYMRIYETGTVSYGTRDWKYVTSKDMPILKNIAKELKKLGYKVKVDTTNNSITVNWNKPKPIKRRFLK